MDNKFGEGEKKPTIQLVAPPVMLVRWSQHLLNRQHAGLQFYFNTPSREGFITALLGHDCSCLRGLGRSPVHTYQAVRLGELNGTYF